MWRIFLIQELSNDVVNPISKTVQSVIYTQEACLSIPGPFFRLEEQGGFRGADRPIRKSYLSHKAPTGKKHKTSKVH